MKTSTTILSLIAAGAGSILTSCVDPYYTGGATASVYRPGYVVQTLPSGYRSEMISGTRYYYHDNVYYRPQGNRYVVVESPHRHGRGNDRDNGWNRDRHDRDRRYDHDRGHGPGRGRGETTVIRELPRGYKVVTRGGQRYYHSGNVYYQQRGNGYVVVRDPF